MTTNDQPSTQGFHGTGWMYEDGAVAINKEEYLLGKKVGRNYEAEGTVGQINAVEYDVAPPSIFASRATHQVDLQRKLMEDPLVAIKKREVEDRKRLMDNPLKMKQLQEHLKSLEKKSKKSKKHKKEKKSKHKKHKRSKDDDSDDDRDSRRRDDRASRIKEENRGSESIRRREGRSRSRGRKDRERSRSMKRERSRSMKRERSRETKYKPKRRRSSVSSDSESDEGLDAKLLARLAAMERGAAAVQDSEDSDVEYESDDAAEGRKRSALLAAGVDPSSIEAPLFSNVPRTNLPEGAPEKGKGDWDCLKCGNWNFVRRTECFKCNTKKGEAKAPPVPAMFVPIPIQKIKKDNPAPVLKKKSQLPAKPDKEEKVEEAKGGGGGASPPSAPGGKAGRPGDWKCAQCSYSNFASRSSCNKCATPKGESGETPTRTPYQRKEGREEAGPTPRSTPYQRGGGRAPSPSPRHTPYQRREGRRSPSPPRRRSPEARRAASPVRRKDEAPQPQKASKKLSDQEKQAKLAEMMSNADWRDEQRTSRVTKQRAEQAKEDKDARREHDPAFMNRELGRAAEGLTMEGRINAKKHTIQRGHGDMDRNFARR